jgi:hypothetical protein
MTNVSNTGYVISVIIPYIHTDSNFINIKKALTFFSNFGRAEIIVVEQGKNKNLTFISNIINKYILAENSKYNIVNEFNISWLYNIGAKYATSNILLLGNIDSVIQPDILLKGVDALIKDVDLAAIVLHDKIVSLDQNTSNLPIDNILQMDLTQNSKSILNIFNGFFMIKKEHFFGLSGWNESLIGDDALLFMHEIYNRGLKMGTIHNVYAVKFYNPTQYMYKQNTYKQSKETISKIYTLLKENNNDKISNYIKSIKEIGMKNKYV